MDIIQKITEELQVKKGQVEAAVKLIDEGNTIPFISRYQMCIRDRLMITWQAVMPAGWVKSMNFWD